MLTVLLGLIVSCLSANPSQTVGEKILRDIHQRPKAGGYTIHKDPWEVERLPVLDEYSRERYPELQGAKLVKLWTHEVEGMIYRITYEDDTSEFKIGIWENPTQSTRQVLMFRRID